MEIKLTREQQVVSDAVIDFVRASDRQSLTISGYAGTGKTTMIAETAKKLQDFSIAFCAPTGKAASVLREKIHSEVYTIHGLIYKLQEDSEILKFKKKKKLEKHYDLIVVDESSMITRKIYEDLLSFNIKIIFLGDSFQLPPVGDGGFSIFNNIDYKLTVVQRQALENSILAVASDIRNGVEIPYGQRGKNFIKIQRGKNKIVNSFIEHIPNFDSIVLCGYNKTRVSFNNRIRTSLGFGGRLPEENERVMCLKNDNNNKIYNGQIYKVISSCIFEEHLYKLKILDGKIEKEIIAWDGTLNNVKNFSECFLNDVAFFDYGYACTVHKSQGSEWRNVLLYDERLPKNSDEEYSRWLYTGVTRAKEMLCIVQ